MSKHFHSFHIVEPSPWPIIASFSALIFMTSLISLFQTSTHILMLLATISILLTSSMWWRDISRESTFQGNHSKNVTMSLKIGMVLFISSEIFFFISFFWAFFHTSLSPSHEIGSIWPPTLIFPFNPFMIPLLNTAILLSSGITLTWSHHSLTENNHPQASLSLLLTISLGILFSALQAFEYLESSFSISDSSFGSTFFMATGFHGLHVIIGTSFLTVCFIRMINNHFSHKHHMGFEAAAWYWHFVDVVWLFLFMFIYWWSQ